jgi:hypothetical protein
MRKLLLLVLVAGALRAAVISGSVVENQTGRRLSRALVAITPVDGSGGSPFSTRTNNFGVFTFSPVPGGAYLVSASRRGFAPVQYGQKRWKGSGAPVFVEENGNTALVIRMPRFAAIQGTVLDDNEVGMQDHDVAAYRNTRPPQQVVRARTDDRGVFRLYGLDPGSYLVRTLAKKDEESAYMPTFYRETAAVEQAYPVAVDLDRDIEKIDIHPALGKLYTVSGQATSSNYSPVTLTLVSDMGSETATTDSAGAFQFNPMPPGQYELYALSAGNSRYRMGAQAAYIPVALDRDRDMRIGLQSLPAVAFSFEDSKGQPITDVRSIQVLTRKKDLSGDGKPESVKLGAGPIQLLPGRWDVAVAPTAAFYVSSIASPGSAGLDRAHPEGWNEIYLPGGSSAALAVRFTLSRSPGALHGAVKSAGEPAIGAPVFLEASDLPVNKRPIEMRVTRTDMRGQYHFYGLAPGAYRVLSSFDFQMPDPLDMTAANARTVRVEEGQELQAELDLYVVR